MRSARQLTGGIGLFRKKGAEGKREAAPPKSRNSWLFGGFVALSMLFAFSNIAYRAVSNIKEVTGTKRFLSTAMPQPGKPKAASQRAQPQTPPATWSSQPAAQLLYSKRLMTLPPAEGFALPPKVLSTLSFETFLFLIAITMLAIGNGELTRPDWDLEWLAVLPVPLTTLLWSRVIGRAVTTQMSLFALLPLIAIVALEAGYGGAALFVGAAAALPLFLIVATIQTVCDTGLRLRLPPAQLRNLQAGLAVLSVVTLFFAMSPGMPSNTNYVVQLGPGDAYLAFLASAGARDPNGRLCEPAMCCAIAGDFVLRGRALRCSRHCPFEAAASNGDRDIRGSRERQAQSPPQGRSGGGLFRPKVPHSHPGQGAHASR